MTCFMELISFCVGNHMILHYKQPCCNSTNSNHKVSQSKQKFFMKLQFFHCCYLYSQKLCLKNCYDLFRFSSLFLLSVLQHNVQLRVSFDLLQLFVVYLQICFFLFVFFRIQVFQRRRLVLWQHNRLPAHSPETLQSRGHESSH